MADAEPSPTTRQTPEALEWEARERALKWLAEKSPNGTICAVCGENDWTVGNVAELPLTRWDDVAAPAAKVYPVFPVFCTNCAHMLLFSAIRAGVIEPDQEEAPRTSKADS